MVSDNKEGNIYANPLFIFVTIIIRVIIFITLNNFCLKKYFFSHALYTPCI